MLGNVLGNQIGNDLGNRMDGSGSAPAVAPVVTSVTSSVGLDTGALVVALVGTGFTGATGVTFGGSAGTSLVVNSDTSITVTTPAHAAGAVNVVVTTPAGSGTLTNGFTYLVQIATLFGSEGKAVFDAGRPTSLSLVGTTVDTWTDLVGGLVEAAVTSSNRPDYQARNSLHNYQPTVDTDFTTPKYLRCLTGVAAALGIGAGDLTYVSIVARQKRATPSDERLININDAISSFQHVITAQSSTTFRYRTRAVTTGFVNADKTASITGLHLFETYLDASLMHNTVDASDATAVAAGGQQAALTQIYVGASPGGGTPGSYEIAAIVIGKSVSGAEITAWRAYCSQRWGAG